MPTASGIITNSVVARDDQPDPRTATGAVALDTTVIKAAVTPPSPIEQRGDTSPPTVDALRTTRISSGKRRRARDAIVVTYSKAMVPRGAGAVGAYRLVSAGRDRRFGTRDDRTKPLRSATYDPATRSVTLMTSGRLQLRQPLKLVINSSTVVDAALNTLDGDRDGRSGGDYNGLFGRAPRAAASVGHR
jgi:hypothetical protein